MKKIYNFINEIDFNIYPTDYQINNYIESYDFDNFTYR